MARKRRIDFEGAWHHVMNRGIAHRRLFESVRDIRYFVSLVAREHRRGSFEIHAYCILSNHVHFLVRSGGELSAAMRRIGSRYVLWFNRTRDRDGGLFRGRFASKRVDSDRYRFTLFRYFDWNPLDAGVALRADQYRFCTAFHWGSQEFPPWLSTWFVENELDRFQGQVSYAERFSPALSDQLAEWIQRRNNSHATAPDPLDLLFSGAPSSVQEWFASRAKIADGSAQIIPTSTPDLVTIALEVHTEEIEAIDLARSRTPVAELVHCALLRELCGSGLREIAARTSASIATCGRRLQQHAELARSHSEYAAVLAQVARTAVRGLMESVK